MIQQLFVNVAILTSFIFIGGQYTQNLTLEDLKKKRYKVVIGAVSGVLGIILMKFGFHFSSDILLDLRYLPIILAASIGGVLSSLTASCFISLGRILLWDVNQELFFQAFISTLILGFCCGLITYLKVNDYKKWILMMLVCLMNATLVLMPILETLGNILKFDLIFIFGGAVIYLSCMSVNKANRIHRSLKDHSFQDFLTGLMNVRAFEKHLKHYIDKNVPLSLVLIDVDYFKNINDSYGHISGDMVLVQFADLLRDKGDSNVTVFRKGGEEFALLISNKDLKDCVLIGKRILERVRKTCFIIENEEVLLTVSIGVSHYPETCMNVNDLFSHADKALYQVKENGRDGMAAG